MKNPHWNFRQPHCQTHETSSHTIIGGSCHKYNFCCNKSFVTTNTCLLQQNTSFVVTKVCLSWQVLSQIFVCVFVAVKLLLQQIFVVTNIILLWQNVCHDKHTFVITNTCLSWQNTSFVTTKICLSRQSFCHNKHVLVATNVCRDKSFVTPSILLSQQKTCFDVLMWQTHVCHDKNCTCGSPRQWYHTGHRHLIWEHSA